MGKIVFYYSSATSDLGVKKHQTGIKNLLDGKKVQYEEVDLAQMQKEPRDAVYAKAGTRTIPLLFVNDKFIGDYETIMNLEEDGQLEAKLI